MTCYKGGDSSEHHVFPFKSSVKSCDPKMSALMRGEAAIISELRTPLAVSIMAHKSQSELFEPSTLAQYLITSVSSNFGSSIAFTLSFVVFNINKSSFPAGFKAESILTIISSGLFDLNFAKYLKTLPIAASLELHPTASSRSKMTVSV